jgi:hypothetical protein
VLVSTKLSLSALVTTSGVTGLLIKGTILLAELIVLVGQLELFWAACLFLMRTQIKLATITAAHKQMRSRRFMA